MAVRVRPATPERWPDVVAAFGRRGQDPSWCWCQRFLSSASQRALRDAPTSNRDELASEIRSADVPPGLVAYVDGRPVGWTRVGPRARFPGVNGNRALARVLVDDSTDVWWVTCFAVDGPVRRSGVGLALLEAAVDFARQHGASAVEGHPVDVGKLQARKVSGSALYTGTVALFAAASFVEVARTGPTRPVMRRSLST